MRRLYICLFVLLPLFSFAKQDSVNCHIEVQDIWDLDYTKSTIKVDFYFVSYYNNDSSKTFSLINGTILSIDTIVMDPVNKFLTLRISAEIRNTFNFERYPLDEQIITIKIEPFLYYEDVMLYSAPGQNILYEKISLNGWKVEKINFRETITEYKIQDRNDEKIYRYSTANFEIPLKRNNKLLYFLKFFLPSLISVLIIYIGFLLPNKELESKLNLSVGSLFVMISNFIGNLQQIPNVSIITIIEKINILSLIIIFLTILLFALNYRFNNSLTKKAWKRINWGFTVISFLTFILLSVFLV